MQDLRAKRHISGAVISEDISKHFWSPCSDDDFCKTTSWPCAANCIGSKKEKFSMPASSTQPSKIVFELLLNHDLCLYWKRVSIVLVSYPYKRHNVGLKKAGLIVWFFWLAKCVKSHCCESHFPSTSLSQASSHAH